MKTKIHISFFVAIIITFGGNYAYACSPHSNHPSEQKEVSCKKGETKNAKANSCCSGHSSDSNDCGGDCNNNNCHCPTIVNIPFHINLSNLNFHNHNLVFKNYFSFNQSIPKPVYLGIWQPPKIK